MRVLLSICLLLVIGFGFNAANGHVPEKFEIDAEEHSTQAEEVKDAVKTQKVKETMKTEKAPEATIEQNNKIIIYYFYQTQRCPSCKKIEEYTAAAVTTKFADQLEAGTFEWKPINVDLEGNEHYMDDYELFTKSVIVSKVSDAKEVKWENLPKIWELLNDKDEFIGYLETEIKKFAEIK